MVIDEWSSTSLSLTYNDTTLWGTRNDPSAEFWDISGLVQFGLDLPSSTAVDLFNVGWLEPDGSGAYNFIGGVRWENGYPLLTDLEIGSDFTGLPAPGNMLSNGAIYSDSVLPFSVQFNDHGDSVSDGGTTAAMIVGALLGLTALRPRIAQVPAPRTVSL